MIEKELQKLGLTEKESSVYVAMLQLGESTALQLARVTSIKRATVYTTLDSLKNKGLVGIEIRGLKQKFIPSHPDQFEAIISSQKERFNKILPDLLGLYKTKGKDKTIRYYEGLESIKTVYETTLKEIGAGDPYFIITKQDNWLRLDEKWFESFVEKRSHRNLDTRIIFQKTKRADINIKLQRALNQKVKVMEGEENLLSDVIICPQRYIVHSLSEPITTIVIENEDIVQTQLSIFRQLWNSLPEPIF